ncbi:MAG: hypothetical protein ABI193_27035 [Minicystis sp.]
MLVSRSIVALSAALLLLAACNPSPDRPDKDAPPPRPLTGGSADAQGSSAPALAASSSAPAAPAPGSLGGTWEGRYEAKKGTIEMPPKVKDKARAADDGKAMAGPGKVELTIAPSGEVHGKATGALGEATLSGKMDVEGGVLRASWFPLDPSVNNAMTGVLIGQLKGTTLQATIRVAGPDATIVREATLDLQRK